MIIIHNSETTDPEFLEKNWDVSKNSKFVTREFRLLVPPALVGIALEVWFTEKVWQTDVSETSVKRNQKHHDPFGSDGSACSCFENRPEGPLSPTHPLAETIVRYSKKPRHLAKSHWRGILDHQCWVLQVCDYRRLIPSSGYHSRWLSHSATSNCHSNKARRSWTNGSG